MKLQDLDLVHRLRGERNYLRNISASLYPTMHVRVGSHDLKPSLVGDIVPAIEAAVKSALDRNAEALSQLGVTLEADGDAL